MTPYDPQQQPRVPIQSDLVFTALILPQILHHRRSCSSIDLRRGEAQATPKRLGFLTHNLVCCQDFVYPSNQLSNPSLSVLDLEEISNLFMQIKRDP